MRGVVTLAAAFLLPADTPQRALLALAAFIVVAGTLLLQGLTLPWLMRRMGLPGPDPAEDALQIAGLVTEAARAGLAVLDELSTDEDPPEVHRASCASGPCGAATSIWEQLGRSQSELEPPAATYRRLRMQMLSAERSSILEARDRGVYDDEVLRVALAAIDMEESLLDRIEDAVGPARRRTGHAASNVPATATTCATRRAAKPRTPERLRGVPAGRHRGGCICGCA